MFGDQCPGPKALVFGIHGPRCTASHDINVSEESGPFWYTHNAR